jgi:hypothetical protein
VHEGNCSVELDFFPRAAPGRRGVKFKSMLRLPLGLRSCSRAKDVIHDVHYLAEHCKVSETGDWSDGWSRMKGLRNLFHA